MLKPITILHQSFIQKTNIFVTSKSLPKKKTLADNEANKNKTSAAIFPQRISSGFLQNLVTGPSRQIQKTAAQICLGN
jgi:hypothetical protein